MSCAGHGGAPLWKASGDTSSISRDAISSDAISGEVASKEIEAGLIDLELSEAGTSATQSTILLSDSSGGISILQESRVGEDRFEIKTSGSDPVVTPMVLSEPPRIVLDILGVRGGATRELSATSDSSVSGIRVGAHSNKVRVVFDLKTEEAKSAHSIDSSTGVVVVTVPVSEQIRTARLSALSDTLREAGGRREEGREKALAQLGADEASNESSFEEVIQPSSADIAAKNSVSETSEAGVSDFSIAESSLDKRDESPLARRPEIKKSASSNIPELSVIDFKKSSTSTGEVTLTMSEEAAFDLTQTSQSEYVLNLPGVSANEAVKNPLVSLKGKDGIRSVRVSEVGGSTQVRMFVDPGITLSALPRGTTIYVKATEGMFAGKAGARAQLGAGGSEGRKIDDTAAQANPTGLKSSDGSKMYTGRLISLDLQDTDIDNALRIIAEVSNLNIIASDDVAGKVTLRLIDVPWDQALDVILKTNGLDQVTEGNVIRIAPMEKLRREREALRESKLAAQNLEDLSVRYIRVSYARAEDIRSKIEPVLTERGTVTSDERTNQLIIKDIKMGQEAAAELLKKLDLRTPQVLLETQIVEGSRTILRDLGFQWNFSYIQSPQTGNATGLNFPNTVTTGGAASDDGGNPWAVNFPAIISGTEGSAISAILDSADGSRLLGARLSALEGEGRINVISRPQVATLNNKQAVIRSETTIRVRMPAAGTTVATGAGAQAGLGGGLAFQEFNVGISLEVTPQASPDYYVLLDVNAKSSTFTGNETDGIPDTREREATSTILVKSGQTFALGGVYRIEDRDNVIGVPFIKDIPVLGHIFRRSSVEKSDEELIFFITPHIVEGSFDSGAM
ncbi:MAG TPA: type IV pilus secretin PilQ [Oligoflexia bacterium]|nr:type IV pilus secretin PilQ [Oligoflexia bacterium]